LVARKKELDPQAFWTLTLRSWDGRMFGTCFPAPDDGEQDEGPDAACLIGRSPKAQVILDDSSVSRKHCCLVRRGDALWVQDLGSANGTQVNNEEIERAQVRSGDSLMVGRVRLDVELSSISDGASYRAPPPLAVPPKLDLGATVLMRRPTREQLEARRDMTLGQPPEAGGGAATRPSLAVPRLKGPSPPNDAFRTKSMGAPSFSTAASASSGADPRATKPAQATAQFAAPPMEKPHEASSATALMPAAVQSERDSDRGSESAPFSVAPGSQIRIGWSPWLLTPAAALLVAGLVVALFAWILRESPPTAFVNGAARLVLAPTDGVLEAFAVEPGATVDPDQVLATFKPDDRRHAEAAQQAAERLEALTARRTRRRHELAREVARNRKVNRLLQQDLTRRIEALEAREGDRDAEEIARLKAEASALEEGIDLVLGGVSPTRSRILALQEEVTDLTADIERLERLAADSGQGAALPISAEQAGELWEWNGALGAPIEAGTPIVTVLQGARWVDAWIATGEAAGLKPGAACRVTPDRGDPITGRVMLVRPGLTRAPSGGVHRSRPPRSLRAAVYVRVIYWAGPDASADGSNPLTELAPGVAVEVEFE
jgi:multidrug resistance efflux pump